MHVEAALSQVYEEPLHAAMSLAHCALQLAPSAVVGLKLPPAAQPTSKTRIDRASGRMIESPELWCGSLPLALGRDRVVIVFIDPVVGDVRP
jgi:hypothetical protein